MKLINSLDYINKKIKELNLPYFECIVKKNSKTIFKYKYTKSKKDYSLLYMYSMSKVITSVAFMQLVSKEKVKLNDNVSKYLDGYKDLKLLNKEKVNKDIKIINLLTMTSGLDYNKNRKAILEHVRNNKDSNTISICEQFAKDGLCFIPSSKFQYSLSIDVIAAIIEKIEGIKFSTYIERNIFTPLKMYNSTFNHNNFNKEAYKEYGLVNNKLKIQKRYYNYFFPSNNYESGGAGLISTIDDYSKFIDSLANRTNKILDDKYVDQIARVLVKDTPFNEGVNEFSKSSEEYGYGLGVRVRKIDSKYGIPKGEFGWDGALGSYCLCDRKNKISIVMGLTIQNWPNYIKDFHIALANNIYKDIFNKK